MNWGESLPLSTELSLMCVLALPDDESLGTGGPGEMCDRWSGDLW